MQQMTEQMQTVIEAAERAAEAIRLDAEDQARRHLAEAQRKADRLTAERVGLISELTDDLVRHAANVRDHSEQMIRALEDAINSVTDKLDQPAMSDPFSSEVPSEPPLQFGDSGDRETTAPPPSPPSPSPFAPPPTPFADSPAFPDPPAGPYPTDVGDPPDIEFEPEEASLLDAPPAAEAPQPPSPLDFPGPPEVPGPPKPPTATPLGTDFDGGSYTDLVGVPPPDASAPPPPPPYAPPPALQPTKEAAESAAAAGDGEPDGDAEVAVSQEALLHATRLAITGEDREMITNALRRWYGIDDPDPIVDRVMGPPSSRGYGPPAT